MAKLWIVENSEDYKFPASVIAKSLGLNESSFEGDTSTDEE